MRDHCFISSELKVLRSGRGLACKEKAGVKMSFGWQGGCRKKDITYAVTREETKEGLTKLIPRPKQDWKRRSSLKDMQVLCGQLGEEL